MFGELRVIDAAANRAREALRVMEDAARFVVASEGIVRELKETRHGLRAAMEALPADGVRRVASRDTPGDVGTGVATAAEFDRAGVLGVAEAAGKRFGEALRSIEEFAKAIDGGGETARLAERCRYRGYEAEKRLMLALAGGRVGGWALCVLVSEGLCKRPLGEVIDACVEGGAAAVQIREKEMEGGRLLDLALAAVERCRGAGVSVIVNDRVDIALMAGADGVHVGQGDTPVEAVRRVAGSGLLVGVSTAEVAEAGAAIAAGADYVGVGPMFETVTKRKDRIAGPAYLAAYLERFGADGVSRPVHALAIGGVGVGNVDELVRAAGGRGGWGVAASGAVCGADDPADVCRRLRGAVESGRVP